MAKKLKVRDMICAATAKGNDVVYLHPGALLIAGGTNSSGQNPFHIGQGNLAHSEDAGAPIVVSRSSDGFGPLRIIPPPLKNPRVHFLAVLLAMFAHMLLVFFRIVYAPLARSFDSLSSIVRAGVLASMAFFVEIWIGRKLSLSPLLAVSGMLGTPFPVVSAAFLNIHQNNLTSVVRNTRQ